MFEDLKFYIKENLGLVSTPVSLFVCIFFVGGFRLPHIFLYAGLIIGALYLLLSKGLIFDKVWALLLLWIPCSIFLSEPDPVFQSWLRFGLFVVLYLSTSSIICSDRALLFRKQCLNIILIFCIILSIGSFFAYFLGINLFVDKYEGGYIEDYLGSAGHFAGLCRHSMILGPVAGIATVTLLFYYYRYKRYIFLILASLSIMTTLFAASRTALFSAIFGFVSILYFNSFNKTVFLKKMLTVLLVGLITYPIWNFALEGIEKKNNRPEAADVFDTRTVKMNARIDEIISSPIYGVGFSAIDPNGNDRYDRFDGTIEPGSSWLAILSMTGIIGFLIVVNLFYKSYQSSVISGEENLLYLGILAFFTLHMIAEGYVFAGGSPISFVLWLTVANCYDSRYNNNFDYFSEIE